MNGSGSQPTWDDDNNITWSELDPAQAAPPPAPPPAAAAGGARAAAAPRPEPERYETLRTLGSGSIGEVRLALDRRLGRPVAYKVLRAVARGNPVAERRFVREAQINARLNHPGIVPVFDAGVEEDGARYYTMRLVKGRSLAEAIAACASLGERLGLMDHYLALVQAMAYAHARGVVHRDLKPANVMVGEFGETQIIDWGLARLKELPEEPEAALWVDLRDVQVTGTVLGTVLGTPRYMSPEQARGEVAAVDERSDVFSLGVILFELLTGRGPFDGGSTFEVLARVREGHIPPVAALAPGAPSELAAIADKAMHPDPAARYPDASALAEDLERWRDGALVGAYAYRARDHLLRFLRQYRLVLSVAGAALLLLAGVGVLSADRVLTERNRAIAAEQAATQRLAASFVLQADAAREAGRWAVAELYAASALLLTEDPVARGVIAGAWARPALALVGVEPTPVRCEELVQGEGFMGCATAERFVVWSTGQPDRLLLDLPGLWSTVSAVGDRITWVGGDEARLYDARGELLGRYRGKALLSARPLGGTRVVMNVGKDLRVVDLADNSVVWFTMLPATPTQVQPSTDGRLLVSLRHDYALELDLATGATLQRFGPVPSRTGVASYSPAEDEVIVGAGTGELVIYDRATGQQRLEFGEFGASVTGLYSLPGLVVVRLEDGTVRVYSLGDGRELAALQEKERPRMAVAVQPGLQELWTGGERGLLRWSVSELERPTEWAQPEGLLDAALSPRGDRLATLTGLRQGALFSLPDGRTLAEWTARTPPGGRRVLFSADGRWLMVGDTGGPLELRSAEDGRLVRELPMPANLLAAGRGRVVGASAGMVVWDLDADRAILSQPELPTARDMDLSADGRTLAWSNRLNAEITVITGLGEPGERSVVLTATEPVLGLSVSPEGQRLAWTLMTGDIVIADLEGRELLRLRGHQHYVQRTAWSPDGARLASAGWDGTARIWDTRSGRELAQLRAHRHRVWSVSFSGDGQTLATSSWDRTTRLWDLRALDVPGAALVEQVRARHGLVLDGARPRFELGD